MQTIILCGGLGTRMREETQFRPKPLVVVGGRPILWHIMKIYAYYGYNDFVLTLGYRGDMIHEYIRGLCAEKSGANDRTVSTIRISLSERGDEEPCTVMLAETGLESLTGERLLRIRRNIEGDDFMMTYGDGVADIDINKLVHFHHAQGTIGTITGVHPYSKYGLVNIDEKSRLVTGFRQKPLLHDYVSGGFMIFKTAVFDYLDSGTMENIFPKLIEEKQLSIFTHNGFWKAMDTYREKEEMDALWHASRPWAVWQKGCVTAVV